jgi:flagellar motor switch protein FliN
MDDSFEKSLAQPEKHSSTAALERALNLAETPHADPISLNSGAMSHAGGGGERLRPQGSLLKIPVSVQVVLGTTRMPLSKVMALGPGSVVVLDKELSEPVVLMVNGNEVARGLIVVVDDKTGQLGISLTEISSGGNDASPSRPV